MTTPSDRRSSIPLHNIVPSFLQQLLDEISGSRTPTVLRDLPTPRGTPSSQPGSRRTSSAWVGGTSIAEDARQKLRAADEARLHKTMVGGNDGAPEIVRPTLHLRIPQFDAPTVSFDACSTTSSPGDPCFPSTVRHDSAVPDIGYAMHSDATSVCAQATSESKRPSGSPMFTLQRSPNPSSVRTRSSPPMFCSSESDKSKTSSPSEPPTSAISRTSTDATMLTNEQHESGSRMTPPTCHSIGHSVDDLLISPVAGKRSLSPTRSPELLPKKMRITTLPVERHRTTAYFDAGLPSGKSTSGDNRCVYHGSTFTERTPSPLELMTPTCGSILPALSSFRPQPANPQGVPHAPLTPARLSTRRSSAITYDESPEPLETPSWARSLHLVDTEVSIYKKIHGDEWRDFPLCLHCFRRHGNFNKIEQHGYEVCGREEPLESHYWQ